jgi:GNAT superfamily N-acetyltransferase
MPVPDLFKIRVGTAADAGELAEFAARTFTETFGVDNRPEDLRAHLASSFGIVQQTEELRDPTAVTLLAYREATLMAFAQVRPKFPPPCVVLDRPIELRRFYVDRSAHGKGLAQLLMSAVHESARRLGGQQLWLGVWERNPRAIAFYKKVGFTDRGSTHFFVGADRQTDRVLVLPLP